MKGLSIGRNHRGPVHRYPRERAPVDRPEVQGDVLIVPQLSDFDEFFSPLYPRLRNYWWFIDGAEFCMPEEWDQWFDDELDRYRGPEIDAFFGEHIATHDQYSIVQPGFLERYAKYLDDDWCGLVGLARCPEDPNGFIRSAAERAALLAMEPPAEIAFFCIDAARWEIFARNADLLSMVRRHLSGRKDLDLREIALQNSRG